MNLGDPPDRQALHRQRNKLWLLAMHWPGDGTTKSQNWGRGGGGGFGGGGGQFRAFVQYLTEFIKWHRSPASPLHRGSAIAAPWVRANRIVTWGGARGVGGSEATMAIVDSL
jgi:hypothetical protein